MAAHPPKSGGLGAMALIWLASVAAVCLLAAVIWLGMWLTGMTA